MQSRSFEPWIFNFAADVDTLPGLPDDLLNLRLSYCIHFSSAVTIRCKKPFLFCRWSSYSFLPAVVRIIVSSMGKIMFELKHNVLKYLGEEVLLVYFCVGLSKQVQTPVSHWVHFQNNAFEKYMNYNFPHNGLTRTVLFFYKDRFNFE